MQSKIKLPCGDPEIKVAGKALLIGPKQGCHVRIGMDLARYGVRNDIGGLGQCP